MNQTQNLSLALFCGGMAEIKTDLLVCDWSDCDVNHFAISVECSKCYAMIIFAPSDTETKDDLIKTATKYWNKRTTKRRKSNEIHRHIYIPRPLRMHDMLFYPS